MSDEIELFAPIKPEGTVVGRIWWKRFTTKALVLQTRRDILDEAGNLIGGVRQLEYCRGEGSFFGPESTRLVRRPVPDRAPDAIYEIPTQRNQAPLIYRPSGDMNPLHADPQFAKDAGFDRPILHGRCTLGASSYAALRFSGRRAEDVRCIKLNFTAPVVPGDTLAVRLWRDDGKIAFSASALERDVLVLPTKASWNFAKLAFTCWPTASSLRDLALRDRLSQVWKPDRDTPIASQPPARYSGASQ